MKTETLELQFNDYKQVWTIEAKDWEKGNAHRIYFSLRLQGERYGEPRQAIWDVNAQSWMAARMDASKMLGDHLIRLYNLLPEPEPPTPTETSEVESVAGQTQEAETSASTIKASSAWQFLPFDGYYQATMSDGRIVRCNKDSFAEAAQECAEAGIELTPENALAYGWDDFYMVDEELAEEVKQPTWGGARKGAGAKPSERSEPLYQQGYQAGYKAASRAAEALGRKKGYFGAWEDAFEVASDEERPILLRLAAQWGVMIETPEGQPTWAHDVPGFKRERE